MDVGQNPVPPVNLKVDSHPLYHMISRFWPIPIWAMVTIWLMVIPSIIRILIMVIINPYEPLDD